jgi:hypothetical protein
MPRLAGLAALLLAAVGCSEVPTRQERPIPTAEAVRAALNVRADDVGQPFDGDAYFGRVPEKNVVFIALDGGDRGQAPDHVIDQVFVIRSQPPCLHENRRLPGVNRNTCTRELAKVELD